MMSKEITTYLQKDAVKSRFSEIMGDRQAASYISSVLLNVANSDQLQKCTPESIYISALRAATLRLSVDPTLGQAYLAEFKGRATLIIGYKGLYDLAIRTDRYRYINVSPIYEGEEVVFDRITGFAHLEGLMLSKNIIGYLGSFEMVKGYSKAIYMSLEEIDAHAKRYSKSYTLDNSPWKIETKKMQQKTVLRMLLRKWGYFDPADAAVIDEIEAETEDLTDHNPDVADPNYTDQDQNNTLPEPEPAPRMSSEQAIADLGF